MSIDRFSTPNANRESSNFDSFRDEDAQQRMAKAREAGAFDSKASIFDYLFFTEGLPLEEAEQQAIKIATIRGVPDSSPKPKTGIESTIDKIEVVFGVAERYPWAKDLLVNVASAAIGAGVGFFAGKEESKSEPKQIQPNLYQQINEQHNGNEPSEAI